MSEILSLLKSIVTVAGRARLFLYATAVIYLSYIVWLLLNYIGSTPGLYQYLNTTYGYIAGYGLWSHLVGLASILATGSLLLWRDRILLSNLLQVIRNREIYRSRHIVDGESLIPEDAVQKHLVNFSRDADRVRIFAGDANFLDEKNIQHEEIRAFGTSCKLLLYENYSVSKQVIRKFLNAGINIRTYSDAGENPSLRGRLKETGEGMAACLFDRVQNHFRFLEIRNTTLVSMLTEKHEEWHALGKHPLYKFVVFSLAGVYLDGDVAIFYERASEIVGRRLSVTSNDYLLISEKLNRGIIDIVQFVEARALKKLTKSEKEQIETIWGETWSLNKGMQLLVSRLKDNGYRVGVASNVDTQNLDRYDLQGWLSCFDYRFMSCECGHLKPSQEFFEHMLNTAELDPDECIYVDMHWKTIQEANKLGLTGVLLDRSVPVEDRATVVDTKLGLVGVRGR